MIACLGTHTTVWFPCRGNEESLVVHGDLPSGNLLELVTEGHGSARTVQLSPGVNSFPVGFQRFLVRKTVGAGAQQVPTTVKLTSR